jgi:hypothetical protein
VSEKKQPTARGPRVYITAEVHRKLRILAALLGSDMGEATEHAVDVCLAVEQHRRGMKGLSPVPDWVQEMLKPAKAPDDTP